MKAEKQSMEDVLKSLDVDELTSLRDRLVEELEAMIAEKQKEISAVKVLLTAALTLRDGAPVKVKKEKKPKAAKAAAAPTASIPAGGPLKPRVVAYLNSVRSARAAQIAGDLSVTLDEVTTLLNSDRDFEHRGVGYFTNA